MSSATFDQSVRSVSRLCTTSRLHGGSIPCGHGQWDFQRGDAEIHGMRKDIKEKDSQLIWKFENIDSPFFKEVCSITLPETNIAPTNGWLEYYFPIGEAYFQGQTRR